MEITMSPEVFERWEQIVDTVEKTKIPVQFIKKLILKLKGRRQRTINIQKMVESGLDSEEIELAVVEKLQDYDDQIVNIEFILDIEGIAKEVQSETDLLLKNL
jgi:hypothetical protein